MIQTFQNRLRWVRVLLALVYLQTLAIAQLPPDVASANVSISQVDISSFHVDGRVTVFFKVRDQAGQPIPASASDVTVLENGNPVDILEFKGFGQFDSRSILVIDVSQSMLEPVSPAQTKLAATQDSCKAFLDVCRDSDQVGLITFNDTSRVVSPLGTPLSEIRDAVMSLKAEARTAWRDALFQALTALENEKGRRTILFLSDGLDNESKVPLEQVTDKARLLQVPINTVGFGTAEAIDAAALENLAIVTGGISLITPTTDQLQSIYRETGRTSQEEMSVTYKSKNAAPDGLRRSVELRVGGAVNKQSFREPHLLTIVSNWQVLVMFVLGLGIAWSAPAFSSYLEALRADRVRRAAWAPPRIHTQLSTPEAQLTILNTPTKIPVFQDDRIVTFRLDAGFMAQANLRSGPLLVVVLLDLSASMEGERLNAARTAMLSLLKGLDDEACFCLMSFSDDAKVEIPPSLVRDLRSSARGKLARLRTGAQTKLAPALKLLKSQLGSLIETKQRKTCVIIVSDGRLEDEHESLQQRNLLDGLNFSAFGIGYDYDLEVLTSLCREKVRVEHLPTAAEADEAFDRFLRLDGQTISSNTSLQLKLTPEASLVRVSLIRDSRQLDTITGQFKIDDITLSSATSLIAEVNMRPLTPGKYRLGEAILTYDLPAYGQHGLTQSSVLEVEATLDDSECQPDPHVMKGVRTLMAGRVTQTVESEVARGDVRKATEVLLRFTRQLFKDGEEAQAKLLTELAENFSPENTADNIKDLRRATRRLTSD